MSNNFTKPIYPKSEEDLFQQLRQQVNSIVQILEPKRKLFITLKAILFPLLYIAVYITALIYANNIVVFYCCYCILGILLVVNFLNLIHEAVHNTLFDNKLLNRLYIYFFDLLGANSYVWKIRHLRLHHTYPNIMNWDSDFEQSPLVRVFPHGKFKKIHQYQHIYLPFLYPIYLFNWVLIRDFKDFFDKKKLVWKVTSIPQKEFIKLFVFKFIYLLYILILPALITNITWLQILPAFLIMIITASMISLLVLLSPHANTNNVFPLPDNAGRLPMTWFLHQLSTTNDVKEDNWFIRFFMGCFNYHVAHHLFPSVHHIYYPEVSEVIKKFTAQHRLPYRKVSLFASLADHYKLLKNNRIQENIFEDTM